MKSPRKGKRNGFWQYVRRHIADPRVLAALIGLVATIIKACSWMRE
jgi:hypothetical protein